MPARYQVDGDGDEAHRSSEWSVGESVEREYRVSWSVDYRRNGGRFDCMNQHRDNGLQEPQRFMRILRLGRDLGVGVGGKGRQAGEDESSESHYCLYFSTWDWPLMDADSRGWNSDLIALIF